MTVQIEWWHILAVLLAIPIGMGLFAGLIYLWVLWDVRRKGR